MTHYRFQIQDGPQGAFSVMQARAADELDAMPADAALREMMADYIRERAQLRVGVK